MIADTVDRIAHSCGYRCGYRLVDASTSLVVYPHEKKCSDVSQIISSLISGLTAEKLLKNHVPAERTNHKQLRITLILFNDVPVELTVLEPEQEVDTSTVGNLVACLFLFVIVYGFVVAPGWMKLWCIFIFPALYWGVQGIAQGLGFPVN